MAGTRRTLTGPARLLAALAVALALFAASAAVAAAEGIEVEQARELTRDPLSVTFSLRVQSEAGLESATLIYKVLNPDGNVGGSGEGAFTPGAETDVTFTLETLTAARYIPVGSRFVYRWELADRDGNTLVTPEREFTFLDGRYFWESRSDGPVTVFWYGDNERNAALALALAKETIERAEAVLGTTVPYPIRLMVYRNERDGELARRQRSATFEQQVDTGGQRVAPDLLFVFAPAPDVIRHETAHIVTHVAGDGPFGSIPSWLDEGFAVYMQSDLGFGYRQAVDFAVAVDRTLPLRAMQSSASRAEEVNLFYGQSFSTVEFMIEEFGAEKFAELFEVFFAGQTIDGALMQVYGMDQNGVYNAWRESKGLSRLALATPPPAVTAPPVEATRAPLGGIPSPGASGSASGSAATPQSQPAPSTPQGAGEAADAASSSGGSSAAAGIVIAVVTLAIAGALGGGAFALLRAGKRA